MPVKPWQAHVNVDLLERYAMGTLPELESNPIEEHLLLCPECQENLKQIDEFIAALRDVEHGPVAVEHSTIGEKTSH